MLSMALHLGIVRLQLPTSSKPPPKVKTPPLAVPQQAVQLRPLPPQQSLNPTPQKISPPSSIQAAPPTQTPPTQTPPTLPVETSVAIESKVRSQIKKPPPKPPEPVKPEAQKTPVVDPPEVKPESSPTPAPSPSPSTQPKTVPEQSTKQVEPDTPISVQPESSPTPESSPSPSVNPSFVQKWDGLISMIQTEESGFGQAQSLQDIFTIFGRDDQHGLFFDDLEEPKFPILSYQLFTDLTPQQVWQEKVLPTLEQQDALEISEESDFAEGKVYKVSKGDFVRYFNVVPLYQPQEVVLIEMAEVPSTEN